MTTLNKVRQRAESDAKMHGYFLNPDPEFLKDLLEGLKENEERYGYPSCPCRMAAGNFEFDRDIICPCDYRDPDVEEYGYCYCALFVRQDVIEAKTPIQPIPERRPIEKQERALLEEPVQTPSEASPQPALSIRSKEVADSKLKMWYCRQCGYVAFREEPPHICPICKAKQEMFSELIIR